MLKGFKEFLLRGNIVDLAVAVVIGTAFTALVAAFTASFINPLIASIGGASGPNWGIFIRHENGEGVEKTFLNVGDFITAIITFTITAAVIYFLVVAPMKKLMARFQKPEEEAAEAASAEVLLLTEIRDLLRSGDQPSTQGEGGTHSA